MTSAKDDYDHIRYERIADHIVRVVLDRPEAANALNAGVFRELDDALDRIDRDSGVRVWVLAGAPRTDGRPWFSAGADLKSAGKGDGRGSIDPARVIDRIDDLLKPSIAVVAGFCTTGALELIMACDIRIAAESAKLSDWHMKATGLGIGQWGAAVRLSRLVGVDKAKELLLTGVELSGLEAERIGLVNMSVPDDELDVAALKLATTIAELPPSGVRATLGFLAIQQEQSKREALSWARLTPEFMGLRLRPLGDTAARFEGRERT